MAAGSGTMENWASSGSGSLPGGVPFEPQSLDSRDTKGDGGATLGGETGGVARGEIVVSSVLSFRFETIGC